MKVNSIYCGDCKDILTLEINPESIDLIYLDPPFFSNKKYEIIWGNGAEIRAFEDRWKGGINHYIGWMEERLDACKAALKDTGSIYTHCDWRATHYLRMAMDRIFGYDNFKNTIVWHFGLGGGPRDHWNRKHNNIHFYTKSDKFTFNKQRGEVTRQMKAKYCHTDNKGKYMLSYGKKYYLKGGKPLDDVWDIASLSATDKERLGYPTQKPEALLERIILASSNLNDVVLDPFCGCGTTLAVAHKNKRKWIGIDVSHVACKVIKKRMENLEGIINVEITGLPISLEELKEYDPFKFQDYICKKLKGKSFDRKSGDMGIDGYILEDGTPIQVKRSDNIGRNIVDNFETAIERKGKNKGIIVAFSFSKSAYEEVARAKQRLDIKLVKVENLI